MVVSPRPSRNGRRRVGQIVAFGVEYIGTDPVPGVDLREHKREHKRKRKRKENKKNLSPYRGRPSIGKRTPPDLLSS
jgi:hypothetical protein